MKGADFEYLDVKKHANFSRAKFKNCRFAHAYFKNNADFSKADFQNCNFMFSNFGNTVDFSKANFRNTAFFAVCKFQSHASFRELIINDSTNFNFEYAILPDTIDFSHNGKIKNEIDLTKACFTDSLHYNKYSGKYFRPHYINLYKSEISKFILDYTHFKLIIEDSIKNELYSETSNRKTPRFIKIPKDEIDAMYEALLNNFKSRGQLESYKLLDIEYQEYKWKNSRFPLLKIFPKYWWNYGYDKERIFFWVFIFLITFTIITFFNFEYLNTVYRLEKVKIKPLKFSLKSIINRLWFSFVYTSIIFFLLTLKVDKINYKKVRGTFYIVLMYSTGIVCLAYMANYILHK